MFNDPICYLVSPITGRDFHVRVSEIATISFIGGVGAFAAVILVVPGVILSPLISKACLVAVTFAGTCALAGSVVHINRRKGINSGQLAQARILNGVVERK